MHIIQNRQFSKLALAFLLGLFWLLFLIRTSQAATNHQTIPTAPPTTAVNPTVPATETSTYPPVIPTVTSTSPPQTTVISTQPTHVLPSHTPGATTSPTSETVISSPNIIHSGIGSPGSTSIPVPTTTLMIPVGTQISTTSAPLTAISGPIAEKTTGYSVSTIIILGVVIVVIFVIGVVSYLKFRRQ